MGPYAQEDSQAWYNAEQYDKRPHDLLGPYINSMKDNQSGRYENARRMIRAYEFGASKSERDDYDESIVQDKKTHFNHARNGIDTVHCKWIKSNVLPMCMTIGGGATERNQAMQMEKALHGEFRKNDWEAIEEQAGLDALVCGAGYAHILHGQPTLTIDWVPFEDIVFDPAETRQKKAPRFMARRFYMDRFEAIDRYSKKEDGYYGTIKQRERALRKCPLAKVGDRARGQLGNVIEVWAAWHQRSGEEAGDGRYAVIIDGATMEYYEWDRDYIPIMPLVPFPRMRSLHGLSLMRDFWPVQREHDKLTGRIQEANHRMGGTHLLVDNEAQIKIEQLGNGQGTVITKSGEGNVKELNPMPVNPQTYEYRNSLITDMYQSKGIPGMTATGAVPEGMAGVSGKAHQVVEEQVAERLMIPLRARNRFMKGVAWRVVEELRAMVEDDSSVSVCYKDERRSLKEVKWKDVLIAKGKFDLDLFPINALAKSPAAKFAQLTELYKSNAITTEQFRRLFELPDIEAENEVDMADINVIDQVMDDIIITGDSVQPEPFDYLELIVQRGRKYYNLCRKKKVPADRLNTLRDYLVMAKTMNDQQKALGQQVAPMGQVMPGGPVQPNPPPTQQPQQQGV